VPAVPGCCSAGIAGGVPVLALDMYEHAYDIDFGADASAYIDAFMRNIDWKAVEGRLQDAEKLEPPRPLAQAEFGDLPGVDVMALREAGFDAKYMKGGHTAWKAMGGAVKVQP
jgi:hypothetical protein